MRILIVGKYPPIQGGVSRSVYWAAQGLAAAGHRVRVVTNAFEAEYGIRQMLHGNDRARLESFSGDNPVELLATAAPFRHRYVPYANPFVSRLAGLIETSLEEFRPDVVIASYFEPYGVATALATFGRDIPVLMTHAGSDLATLAKSPELQPVYRRILARADKVLTLNKRPGVQSLLRGLGVPDEKMVLTFGNSVEPIFSPEAARLDLAGALAAGTAHMEAQAPFSPELKHRIAAINAVPLDPARPLLALFGKVGAKKGSFQLLESLARLARAGRRFHFIAIPCGMPEPMERFLGMVAADPGLAEATRILPPLAHWRIAELLRTVDLGFFLEHEFPVGIHSPRVAREILASGTALVLAREQAERMRIGRRLVAGENFIPVSHPDDAAALDNAIGFALDDPARLAAIAAAGRAASQHFEGRRKTSQQRIEQAVAMLYGR